MSQDDPFAPFGDDDKTLLRPMPGGRRGPRAAPEVPVPPPTPPQPHNVPPAIHVPDLPVSFPGHAAFADNPFVAAAASMLSLVSRLRNTPVHNQIAELQQQLVRELREFENRLLQQGIPHDQVRVASYALCSLLDETILNTPWGSQSFWSHQSLLVLAHKEAWGGERFFQYLENLMRQPAQSLLLLEFFWLCLSLGFGGKYRIAANGASQLEQVRDETFNLIQRVRGDFDRNLSPRWEGLKDVRNPLMRFVPLWVIAAAAAALLLLAYLGFAFFINGVSDPVARDLFALSREEAQPIPGNAALPATPVVTAKAGRFKPILAAEISQNMVEVVDDRILRIHNSFTSGSDRLKPEFGPLFGKIAGELRNGGDSVLITGHTDDKPIFSARFPSNFELSAARAKHVADLLVGSGVLQNHVKAEGRADYEPLVPNDSPEHRAVNRRVDILVQ